LTIPTHDGLDGSGVAKVEYAVVLGAEEPRWEAYDTPTLVLEGIVGHPMNVTLMVRAYDVVGNEASPIRPLEIDWDAPSLNMSSFWFGQLVNSSPLSVHRIMDGDVARVHLQVSNPYQEPLQDLDLPVDEGGAIDFDLQLRPGPNYLRASVEDRVGNTSPWESWVVTLDTDAPAVVAVTPMPGSRNASAIGLMVSLEFSEAIDRGSWEAEMLVDGEPIMFDTSWDIDWDNKLSLIPDSTVSPGSKVEVSLGFQDLAGNRGSSQLTFWTSGGTEQSVRAGDFLWGLFIGLVLGMVVAYLVVLRLRRGSSPRRPPGPQPLLDMGLRPAPSILAPDEERLDDRDVGTSPSGPTAMASAPSTRDDLPKGPPPSRDGEFPGQAPPGPVEGVGQEGGRRGEGGHGGEAGHVHDDEVDEELSADLDRLIEQATQPSSPAVSREFPDGENADVDAGEGSDGEHLPDPEEETVDPGAR